MAGIVPAVGEVVLLNAFLGEDQVMRLYINDYTPDAGSTAGSFMEMHTQGYAAKALGSGAWIVTQGYPSRAVYAQQVWTFDGTGPPTVVYGYYIVQAVSGTLMFAERFGSPPTIANRGDQVKVIPSLDAYSREEIHA